MAMKINAGDFVRKDLPSIDPQEIIVNESKNGRRYPHGDPEVAKLVRSYETYGQQQPVTVRRIADNKVELVAGFRRHRAAMQYNALHPDKPMKLDCRVVILNDEEAFLRNLEENHEREQTSHIDNAHNQNRLRVEYGWTDVRIAERFGQKASHVCNLKKLLLLPNELQERVHFGSLSLQAALALADLPTEAEQLAIANASQSNVEVLASVRTNKIERGQKLSRSMKEIRRFFEAMTGPAEVPAAKELAENFLKFIEGKIKDETMERRYRETFASATVLETVLAAA